MKKLELVCQSFFNNIIRTSPEEFEKRGILGLFMYRLMKMEVSKGHIGVALDLGCDDEELNNLILNMG